jgi:tetratricopeptide (TPR) repeat protein
VSTGEAGGDVTPLLQEAEALLDIGRTGDAIARAAEAARRAPQDARAFGLWARALLAAGQPEAAARMAAEAVRLAPFEALHYRVRSRALAEMAAHASGALRAQMGGQAVEAAWQGVELEPHNPNSHIVLAEALSLIKDFADANAAMQEAIRGAPNSVTTWVTASLVAIRQRDWNAAIDACERALALDPNNYAALNNLGVALRASGRGRRGSEVLARAAAVDPDATTARRNLSRAGVNYARLAVLVLLIPIGLIAHIGLTLYLVFAVASNIVISRRPDLVLRAERWAAPLALFFARRTKAGRDASPRSSGRGRGRTGSSDPMAPWTVTRRGAVRTSFVIVGAALAAFFGLVLLSVTYASPGLDKIPWAVATAGCSVLAAWLVLVALRRRR